AGAGGNGASTSQSSSGGTCQDPTNCGHCGAFMKGTIDKDQLCCESAALQKAMAACICETACASVCKDQQACTTALDGCDACIAANCQGQFDACQNDCPAGTPGCGTTTTSAARSSVMTFVRIDGELLTELPVLGQA